ncbi:MAG: hypothetical protein R2850_13445 [Bacteroidia bacterium]
MYVTPFIQTGQNIDLSHGSKSYPVVQVAEDAGISLHWSENGKKLNWTLGEEYVSLELGQVFNSENNSCIRRFFKPVKTGSSVGLRLKADRPEGIKAYTNARIITMKGDEVIENGSIIINGNRISEIGNSSDIKIPAEAEIIDCKGKTIMPGLIDVHAHLETFRYGTSPQQMVLFCQSGIWSNHYTRSILEF